MLIRSNEKGHLDIAAWTVPDIDAEVHNPPALLGATIPPRITFTSESLSYDQYISGEHRQLLDTVLLALPLDDLVMLAAQDIHSAIVLADDLSTPQFWFRHAPRWPLLQRVRVAFPVTHGFIQALLEDNGGHERPLLPSLLELVVDNVSSHRLSTLPLRTTLMKRVEQGVPLDVLDLRTCYDSILSFKVVRPLSEIVANVLGPEPYNTANQMRLMWMALARHPFIEDDIYGEETLSDPDDIDTGGDEDEDDEE